MAELTITAEPGSPLVHASRTFDAPRELVFEAFTEPELVAQWLGPHGVAIEIERYEARDGGRWRYVHTDAEGSYGFHGVFHGDPSADGGIVQTFEYEGWPGKVSLDTTTFEDHGDGTTTVHMDAAFRSVEDRDAMVGSGMESGLREGYERLEELLSRQLKARHDAS
jgi:uncharacterized protein YndB with AHSA1/START domain